MENQIFYIHGLDRVAKQDFSLLHRFPNLWRTSSLRITYPNNAIEWYVFRNDVKDRAQLIIGFELYIFLRHA